MAGTKSGTASTGEVPPRPRMRARPAGRSTGNAVGAPKPRRPGQRALARQMVPPRRRHSIYKAAAGGGLVVVVIVGLALASIFGGKNNSELPLAAGTYRLPANVMSEVEGVPVGALAGNAETASGGVTPPKKLPPNAPRLSSDGHPEIMYIGAEFCFPCIGERWALVMALSKFGTFNNLSGTASSASHIHPGGPTFSFYGATYTSKYLSFVTDEESPTVIKPSAHRYESVQTLTREEHNIITAWDVPPYTTQSGSIPFVYMGGKFALTGARYDASAIWQMNFQTAVGVMTSGRSAISKQVEAAAGYLVGDFCALTRGQPARVCSQVPSSLIGITTSSAKN